jgi:hypothetical protein
MRRYLAAERQELHAHAGHFARACSMQSILFATFFLRRKKR